MIRHIVLLRFDSKLPEARMDALLEPFTRLVGHLDGLLAYSGGPYRSPEGINRGYNYAFTMDFRDAAARDAYLPSPAHLDTAGRLMAHLAGSFEDSVIAFDYVC